jgi:hypothetical protein
MDSDFMLHTFSFMLSSCRHLFMYLEQSLWTSLKIWLGNQAFFLYYDRINKPA